MGIVVIHEQCRGTLQRAPTQTERFAQPTSNSIPTIVRLFKSATTTRINVARGAPGTPVWQRGYYEHVIRNEAELTAIREYTCGDVGCFAPTVTSYWRPTRVFVGDCPRLS